MDWSEALDLDPDWSADLALDGLLSSGFDSDLLCRFQLSEAIAPALGSTMKAAPVSTSASQRMPVDPFETPLILTEATILPTSLVYIRSTWGPILFSDLLSIPIHRLAKPFFKINRHSIAERLPRSLN